MQRPRNTAFRTKDLDCKERARHLHLCPKDAYTSQTIHEDTLCTLDIVRGRSRQLNPCGLLQEYVFEDILSEL